MVTGKVVLGDRYVLSIVAPRDEDGYWSFVLTHNDTPRSRWGLPDVNRNDEPTDVEYLIDATQKRLYNNVSHSLVDKKSKLIAKTITKLINEYRL